jgi:hypothetical protein
VAYVSVVWQQARKNEIMVIARQRLHKCVTVLEPRQQPACNNGSTIGSGVFYWLAPRLYYSTDRVEVVSTVQCSAMIWLVSEGVTGLLRFSPCEQLLLEADSWDTGIVREPRVSGTSAAGSRYQTTTSEYTVDWEDLMRAVVNCEVCELAIEL